MKKIWMGLAAVALVASLCVTGALAAGHRGQGLRYTDGSGSCGNYCVNFADADGDGICNHHGTRCTGFADTDGDGICDNCDTRCAGFTDADGDGICDNYGTGLGSHRGGHGRGGCRNY